MNLIRLFLLLPVLFLFGCGSNGGGSVGDENDPVLSGTDEVQANEKDGAVVVTFPE